MAVWVWTTSVLLDHCVSLHVKIQLHMRVGVTTSPAVNGPTGPTGRQVAKREGACGGEQRPQTSGRGAKHAPDGAKSQAVTETRLLQKMSLCWREEVARGWYLAVVAGGPRPRQPGAFQLHFSASLRKLSLKASSLSR